MAIDRDINGAMNIAQVGLLTLLYGYNDRPPHLRTKRQIRASLGIVQGNEDMQAAMEADEEEEDEMEIQR